MSKFIFAFLQLFADIGSNVMTTTGTANAYTGAVTTTTAMDPTIKTFYDTVLLRNTRVELKYQQFATHQKLPRGRGKTIEWRKFDTFAPASKLVEAVIPNSQTFGMSHKTATIDQYGTYAVISDQLELHAYDDILAGASEEMSASAAETMERLARSFLLTNANVYYCDNITVATGAVVSTPTDCATMEASATTMSKLTGLQVAKIVTAMKKNRAPMINGRYYMVIHPSVAFDLRRDPEWIEVHKYSATREIFNGEIGELHGMAFIEDTFAPILGGTTYQNKAGTKTYACFVFGKDAYGDIDVEGGNLQMIAKSKEQAGGPLDQFSSMGYKFEQGYSILYPERLLRVMCCSSYSAVDSEN